LWSGSRFHLAINTPDTSATVVATSSAIFVRRRCLEVLRKSEPEMRSIGFVGDVTQMSLFFVTWG
jgi:hypothetical protein